MEKPGSVRGSAHSIHFLNKNSANQFASITKSSQIDRPGCFYIN